MTSSKEISKILRELAFRLHKLKEDLAVPGEDLSKRVVEIELLLQSERSEPKHDANEILQLLDGARRALASSETSVIQASLTIENYLNAAVGGHGVESVSSVRSGRRDPDGAYQNLLRGIIVSAVALALTYRGTSPDRSVETAQKVLNNLMTHKELLNIDLRTLGSTEARAFVANLPYGEIWNMDVRELWMTEIGELWERFKTAKERAWAEERMKSWDSDQMDELR